MADLTTTKVALDLYAAGYCPIRATTDGEKKPFGAWKQYQTERPTEDQVRAWFSGGYPALGIVTGAASGNAEMLEFEGRAVRAGIFEAWGDLMDASGLGEIKTKLIGWVDFTPSGGIHFHYRIDGRPVPGNTKLAERPATTDELAADPDTKRYVLIETRGEGGFVVTAPSNGTTHPSGKPWTRSSGGPRTTPVLTVDEHEALMTACRALDQMPEPAAAEPNPFANPTSGDSGGDRPGDDYNHRGRWEDILTGWTKVFTAGTTSHWRRPGKTVGTSATTGRNDADNLYVFSTSTEFDPEKPYSKFAAYTLLEHHGDYRAAAKALAAAGYGNQKTHTAADAFGTPNPEPPDDPWGDDEPPPVNDADAEFERRIRFELNVNTRLDELRILDEARHRLAVEHRGHIDPPELLTLRDRLARPRTPTRWRIDGWQPAGSRVVLAAQFKAGKTTLVGNLIRSLVDGDDWLDKHEATPVSGTVAVLDFEMGADQLDDWLRDQQIRKDDQVLVIPMRGRAALFDLLDDRRLAEWAKLLHNRSTEYLIVDCLRPILDALGLDEHRDAGRFFVALDQLLADAGISDGLLTHHMGHYGERSRGDSRIRDWPDVEWRLVRQDDQPGSARYISAYGRDVDITESELLYDPTSRHLTVIGGSRRDAAIRAALRDMTAVLNESDEPLTGRAIELALAGSEHTRANIRRGLALGIRIGTVHPQPGPHRSTLHTVPKPAAMSDSSAPKGGGALPNEDQTSIGSAP